MYAALLVDAASYLARDTMLMEGTLVHLEALKWKWINVVCRDWTVDLNAPSFKQSESWIFVSRCVLYIVFFDSLKLTYASQKLMARVCSEIGQLARQYVRSAGRFYQMERVVWRVWWFTRWLRLPAWLSYFSKTWWHLRMPSWRFCIKTCTARVILTGGFVKRNVWRFSFS